MPTTLEKARKHITKKKGADASGALHQFSRDSKRLQTAQIRDERLEKLARSRKKRDKPLRTYLDGPTWYSKAKANLHIVERVAFFQEVSRANGGKALEMATIQSKIHEYVCNHFAVLCHRILTHVTGLFISTTKSTSSRRRLAAQAGQPVRGRTS